MSDQLDDLADIYHVERDAEYLRQAKGEAEHFDQPRFMNIDAEWPETAAYRNERFTGDPALYWFETIPTYGTFQRGCALGAGGVKQRARILEQNPHLHLTIYDISGESLAILERELGGRFPDRVATQTVDLNFAALPENAYDLIISSDCIHHLYNLEHIAYQINRSLKGEGILFLTDYVGEARFQFSDEKKRIFEEAFAQVQQRIPKLRTWRTEWPDLSDWPYSPFEAVRADETLDIFRRYMVETGLRAGGPILGLVMFVRRTPAAPEASPVTGVARWRRRLRSIPARLRRLGRTTPDAVERPLVRLATELIPLDRELAEADGSLLPMNAFAIYRKRQLP